MSKKIVFKYTSRSRPDNFFRGLRSIIDNCVDNNYEVLCSFDEDDKSMNNPFEIGGLGAFDKVIFYFGTSNSKISAINNDLDKLPKDWGILINMSDDMVFIEKGFDNLIRKAFEVNFPNGDGFLHIHDGCQNRLATMSIIDKKHFDRFGYIYHPDFKSVYVDNFHQEYAQKHGCYHYMGDNVRLIEHLHPLHKQGIPMDAQYVENEKLYDHDREVYYRIRKEYNL